MLNRFRLYTGPTLVQGVAEMLRKHAGTYHNVFEGTEHVYFETTLNQAGTFQQLKLDGLTGFTYNDLQPTAH